ncbi:MAG: YtrH family sporulation protein [Firmicutes bacterium]|nr:YtrH family sporulation protein [Bacillota bacterium]
MSPYTRELILSFFVSAGIVLGGALVGSLSTILTGALPLDTMSDLAKRLKIWGAVASLGGTFTTFESLDMGLFQGQLGPLLRQGLFVLSAFLGADLACRLVAVMAGTSPWTRP